MKRRTVDERLEALDAPGFTPALRDIDELVDRLAAADRDRAETIERALRRAGAPALPRLRARFAGARPPLRARLCRLLGRIAPAEPTVRALLFAALEDRDEATRRAAAGALGRLRQPDAAVETALLRAWHAGGSDPIRRVLAEALGKVGSTAALQALRAAHPADPETARRAARAVLMLERTAARGETSTIRADTAPERPRPVRFHCRAGLEPLVVEELGPGWRPRIVGPGQVEADLHGPLASAWTSRIAAEFGLALPPVPRRPDEPLAAAVVRLLTGAPAIEALRRWTAGPIRYRLSFVGGGHRRAVVWEVARRAAAERPDLRNDPRAAPWELRIAERTDRLCGTLYPRGLADPRFAWRVADVPASSHPTIAAALARVAGARDDDVVWDPFVGAGAELLERARLGPYARLIGTDIDERALTAARRNAAAAGVRLELVQAEATAFAPPQPPTLVLTNPPMGRRTGGHRTLGALLERFVEHAANHLAPGGRLVWITPRAQRTDARARAAGLRLETSRRVDLGGFRAVLQRWRKPESARPPGPGDAPRGGRRHRHARTRGSRPDTTTPRRVAAGRRRRPGRRHPSRASRDSNRAAIRAVRPSSRAGHSSTTSAPTSTRPSSSSSRRSSSSRYDSPSGSGVPTPGAPPGSSASRSIVT